MKVIFTYTIPHTGTHFVMDLQSKAVDGDKSYKVDDMWWGNHYKDGANFEDFSFEAPVQGQQLRKMIYNHMNPEDKVAKRWTDLELLLVKGHHWHRGRPLMDILHKHDPEDMFFVSPLRDPFLAIMTRSWQGWYQYGKRVNQTRPVESRNREARRITQTFVDMLTTQPNRVFLFPIDGEYSKSETGKRVITERLYKHCGLEVTEATEQFVQDWKPVNTSKEKSEGAGRVEEIAYSKFEEMKQRYKDGDTKFISTNGFCKVEFEFLQREEWLKRLLENAGYSNLPWW